jgi:hypothetical protein
VMVSGLFFRSGIQTMGEFLGVLLMVPTNFVVAVLCAVYPKQYFGFANVDVYGRQPYLFYALAAGTASSLAFVIGLVIRLIRFQDGTAAFLDAYQRLPYLLLTFVLTLVVAVRIQDKLGEDGRRRLRGRAADALVVATSLALAMVLVMALLPLTNPGSTPPVWSPIFTALIGAFIGFYVPARFRTDLGKLSADQPVKVPRDPGLAPLRT